MENISIIDELFSRIQSLEEENKKLKNKINELEIELVKKEGNIDDLSDTEKEENKNNKMIIDDEIEVKPVKSVSISYIPNEDLRILYIMGDFTNWELVEMKKELSNIFTFNILLLTGFKYFYSFFYDDQPIVDFGNLFEENPNNSQINNVIYLANEENKFDIYEHNKNKKVLDLSRKHFFKRQIGNEDDVKLIEESIAQSINLKSKSEKIQMKKNDKLNRIKKSFDLKLEEIKKSFDGNFKLLNNKFKGRIIKKNDVSFLVESVGGIKTIKLENSLKCIRLYDKNGIKINIDFYKSKGFLEKIDLNSLFLNTIILSPEDSKSVLEEYKSNTTILKIFYKYYENNSPKKGSSNYIKYANQFNNNFQNEMSDRNLVNSELDLVPYKVEPDYIDLNHYKIDIADNKIIEVKEKESNLKVLYESQVISNEIETKFSSLVSQSVLKVFTCLYSQNIVNIVHIHLNDTSESIAVDSFFLEKHDSISDFKKFDYDISGKKLNYKFLFRDFKLIKILYNVSKEFIDEPKFEEIRISHGRIIKLQNFKGNEFYAKITKIPLGMLSRKEIDKTDVEDKSVSMAGKEAICTERYLEELPGYIEIELLFDANKKLLDIPLKISLPVCHVQLISNKEEVIFEKILLKNENYQKYCLQNELNSLYSEFENLQRFIIEPKSINEIMLDEAKIYLNKVQHSYPILIDNIAKNIEDNEENINKINFVHKISSQLIPILTQHIRAQSFSLKK